MNYLIFLRHFRISIVDSSLFAHNRALSTSCRLDDGLLLARHLLVFRFFSFQRATVFKLFRFSLRGCNHRQVAAKALLFLFPSPSISFSFNSNLLYQFMAPFQHPSSNSTRNLSESRYMLLHHKQGYR